MTAFNKKMRRILIGLVCLALCAFYSYRIYRDIILNPDDKYTYGFLFLFMAVFVSLTAAARSKAFILRHARGVTYSGIGLIILGAIMMIGVIAFGVATQMQPSSSKNLFYLALGPMFVGSMVAMMPTMIRLNGPLTDFLRKLR